ncbi:MAG: hypothetical protein AYK22_01725 [Thermoplasmatales archaeon SG8-52-3]|nr:MAG: hypothetical protein AYK22_01725 [Thermoplasmatales archaeon SG8-52-3]
MNRRIAISLIIAIITVFPSITATNVVNIIDEKNELSVNLLDCDLCPVHPIDVTKMVWDLESEEWTDYYETEMSEKVLFNITITYHKNSIFGNSAKDIQVIDNLPSGFLFEGSVNFNESFINGSLIYWNLSNDYGIILYDDESISIEFEVFVTEYGEHENFVEVYAFETGCEWDLYGDAEATVYGVPPNPSFVKKVKNPETGEWVNETFQYVTETVTFKIELIYYGLYNLTDVKIVDYLPEVTYFAGVSNIEPSNVSEDGKIIWWNLSEYLETDESLVIIYDAYVWGRTGDCSYCGINLAEYNAIENITWKDFNGEDIASIITNEYDDPKLSFSPNNIDFGNQYQGWTGSDTFEIWNSGQQILSYTISESLEWLEVTPKSGSSDGEHDKITVSVGDTTGMSGYYGGSIDISSNGGSGSVFISIYIEEVIPIEPELKVTIKRGICRSIKVNIENTGEVEVQNISWNIQVNRRGLIKRTLLDINGTIPSIEIGSIEQFGERFFGIGLISVDVNVSAPGLDSIEINAKGFVIFRFVRIRRFI